MIIYDSKVRVRYGETDKMGYAYYGIYPQYYEIGRTELIRSFGLSYKKLEDDAKGVFDNVKCAYDFMKVKI